jgi:hypothetical protein
MNDGWPFLVGNYINWLSDQSAPITTAVDLIAAFDTNQYPVDENELPRQFAAGVVYYK